jgi:hypothetical protein
VVEIELGRGTTPLPAGLEAEGVTEQRNVSTADVAETLARYHS